MDDRARDTAIAERIQSGDKELFEMFVHLYERPVYNFVLGRVVDKNAAPDLTQEVFLKAYRSIGSYDPKRSSFRTWLYTIAHNQLRDHARRSAVRTSDAATDARVALSAGRAVNGEEVATVKDQIERLISTLDDETRNLLSMKFFQDLTYEGISAITGIPQPTLRSKINRALKRLKVLWAKDGEVN